MLAKKSCGAAGGEMGCKVALEVSEKGFCSKKNLINEDILKEKIAFVSLSLLPSPCDT